MHARARALASCAVLLDPPWPSTLQPPELAVFLLCPRRKDLYIGAGWAGSAFVAKVKFDDLADSCRRSRFRLMPGVQFTSATRRQSRNVLRSLR